MSKKKYLANYIYFSAVAVVFILFVFYNWIYIKNENVKEALKISESVAASLSKVEIQGLDVAADDTSKIQYQALKRSLQEIIRINSKARFVYILTEKNGKLYFMVDSEPENSKDYSPPGEEYKEAKAEDKQTFVDGECHMTKPLEDRWGTWRTVYVPIKDKVNKKTIAVLGMDYDARFWRGKIIEQTIIASILIAFLLIILILHKVLTKYKALRVYNNELRMTQMALKESEEKYRTITQSTLDIIFIVNKRGKQLFFNESVERVLGYKVEELIGRLFTDFVPKSEFPKYLTKLQDVFINKEIRNFVTKIYHKDGHLVDVEINGKLIRQNNQYVGLGTIIDITDHLKAEQEIKSKNEELAMLNDEKDRFFSIIAHDLRSPFNGFLGLTQVMSDGSSSMTPGEIQDHLRALNKSARNLFKLIENLLDWAQMRQGLISFAPEKIDFYQMVENNSELFFESARRKKISLSNLVPKDFEVFADKNMLQTIIRNLSSNAIKFTHIGGEINISVKKDPTGRIVVSIQDSGIGMSSIQVANLFNLGQQQNRKGTDNEPSTGLGLLLCKEFMEKHGGKIWVESIVDKGSVFYISFPPNV